MVEKKVVRLVERTENYLVELSVKQKAGLTAEKKAVYLVARTAEKRGLLKVETTVGS